MKNKAITYLMKIHHQKSTVEKKKLFDNVRKLELAIDELKSIHLYEKQLLIAIPILLKSATSSELIETLSMLNKYTTEHVKKLEANFSYAFETKKENKLN